MTDDGIILRVRSYKEYDQLVTFFFRRQGKMTAVARGGKRSRKRFGGLIGIFKHLSCELKKNRNSSLLELQEASVINHFMVDSTSFEPLLVGSYLLDLVINFTHEQHPNSVLFDSLISSLTEISRSKNIESTIRRFEWDVLKSVGYKPELSQCIRCKRKRNAKQGAYVYIDTGGIVCKSCKPNIEHGYFLSAKSIKFLLNREILDGEKEKRELRDLLPEFIKYYLDRELPSFSVLENMMFHFEESTSLQQLVSGHEMRE